MVLVTGLTPRQQGLLHRMEAAHTTADETGANYEKSKAILLAGKNTAAERLSAARDDRELQYLAGKAAFHSDLAVRLALVLLVDLTVTDRQAP